MGNVFIYELRKLVKLVDEFITSCLQCIGTFIFIKYGLQILVKKKILRKILVKLVDEFKL